MAGEKNLTWPRRSTPTSGRPRRVVPDEFDEAARLIGARGIGELGATGVDEAVAAAVHDAVGVRVRDVPILPWKVLGGGPLSR